MGKYICVFMCSIILAACAINKKEQPYAISKIGFGSCGNQDMNQPILNLAAYQKLDAFVFLSDNIYGDTDNMDTLANKYKRWKRKNEYQKLKSSTTLFATWDDHDFGRNDAGKHYPLKEASKEIFMQHFDISANHEMRKHKGIYHTNYIYQHNKVIQLIMLDGRTFRNNLLFYSRDAVLPRKKYFYELDYVPHVSKDSTLLGQEQWTWLEGELQKPADIRLVCSGSQFGIEFNGYEAWANFPHEQSKMLELIKKTKANGVIFLSGDVHYAEISKLNSFDLYPIYDITSSGITSTWDFATYNKNRIEGPIMENHFGMLNIKWDKDPIIECRIIDVNNNERIHYTIKLSEIQF